MGADVHVQLDEHNRDPAGFRGLGGVVSHRSFPGKQALDRHGQLLPAIFIDREIRDIPSLQHITASSG